MSDQQTISKQQQRVFDVVCRHAALKRPAKDEKGKCYYRGPNGTKCFVGALIPDDKYIPEIENKSPYTLKMQHAELLMRLQDIHDNRPPEDWFASLKSLAFEYNLSTEVLDNL